MIDQPIYSRKAYIIVGINKNNPTDIIGYCENSFSMGWTRHWVNIWTLEYNSKKMAEAEVTQLYVSHFCELYNKGEKYYKNCIAPYDKEKYGKFLEKAFSGKVAFEQVKQEVFKHFFNTTTYSAQGVWNHIKQHLSTIPDGYEIKIFRLNSKNCQIICDLRHRYAFFCPLSAAYSSRTSRTSRRLSPSRLKITTVIRMASPGKIIIHGAYCI